MPILSWREQQMNNGNLLNSLLGASGANSVIGKNQAPKNRVDGGEKFRNAFEQARPEVAVARPEKPKVPTSTKAPASNRREAEPREVSETTVRKKPPAKVEIKEKPVERKVTETNKDKPEVAAVNCDMPRDTAQIDRESTDNSHIQVKTSEDDSTQYIENEIVSDLSGELSSLTNEEFPELGNTIDVAVDDIALSVDTVLSEGDTVMRDDRVNSLIEDINGGDVHALNDRLEINVGEDGQLPVPPGSVIKPEVLPTPGVLTDPVAQIDDSQPSLVTPLGVNTSQVNLKLEASTASGNPSGITNNSMTNILNQSGQEVSIVTEQVSMDPDPDLEMDAAKNPDLFLLSGKATLGKIMDSALVGDKAAAVVDPAKPLLTATNAVEPLARLSEAQSPATRSFVVQTGIPVTVGQPQWNQAVGEKVLWLAAQNVSTAEIRLDPPDLGTMHVKVTVNQDQASVTFTSPHPVVREALDQQLNRLREMFSEQGLNLVNVDVSDHSFARQQQDGEQGGHGRPTKEQEEQDLAPVAMTAITSTYLVDHYA